MDNPLFDSNSLDMAIMVLVYHIIENPDNLFKKITLDSVKYDLSEKVFTILGYEFIGAKSYAEAVAVLNMAWKYIQNHQNYTES